MECGRFKTIKQVMRCNHDQRESHHQSPRQADKCCQQDHRKPKTTDHAEHSPTRMKCPGKANDGELQYHQPEAARNQKSLQPARRMPYSTQICAYSSKKEKSVRAQVSYPSDEKVESPGLVNILRFEGNVADEITRVIEGHEYHDKASQDIDGSHASSALIGNRKAGVLN